MQQCQRWHGSPAQRTEVDYRTVDPTECGTLRRVVYPVVQLLMVLVVFLPLAIGAVSMLDGAEPQGHRRSRPPGQRRQLARRSALVLLSSTAHFV
jgi:hypothetical protein